MVKIQAAARKRTVNELVIEFVEQGLGCLRWSPNLKDHPRIQVSQDGLPAFKCRADAPATLMEPKELLALEQTSQTEEDCARVGIPF